VGGALYLNLSRRSIVPPAGVEVWNSAESGTCPRIAHRMPPPSLIAHIRRLITSAKGEAVATHKA
jgi:hypothetical protein